MALIDVPGIPPIETNLYGDSVAALLAKADSLVSKAAPGIPYRVEWRTANANENSDGTVTINATAAIILQREVPDPPPPGG